MIERAVVILECLGGARRLSPRTTAQSIALGLWWLALIALTLLFAGRHSKFIYVDF